MGIGHGVACDNALDLGGFSRLRAQELEPGGLVAEEVFDRNAGADGGAGRTGLVFGLAVADAVACGGVGVVGGSRPRWVRV